jgi:histidine triad (HIT) family protein
MHRHAPPDYDCPFCAFVGGEERPPWNLRADLVWQDDQTTAWMNPRWCELDRAQAAAVHETAQRIATAMLDVYPCDGITTRQNSGPGADQEVWHYHLHVFPRHRGDGFDGSDARLTDPDERLPYAERLRAAL